MKLNEELMKLAFEVPGDIMHNINGALNGLEEAIGHHSAGRLDAAKKSLSNSFSFASAGGLLDPGKQQIVKKLVSDPALVRKQEAMKKYFHANKDFSAMAESVGFK